MAPQHKAQRSRRLLTALALAASAVALSACNAVYGLGTDLQVMSTSAHGLINGGGALGD